MKTKFFGITLIVFICCLFFSCSDDGSSSKSSPWEKIGNGISEGGASFTVIDTDSSGNPIVAYRDDTVNNNMTVQRYSGSQWEVLGTQGVTDGPVCEIDIDEYGGVIYAAYKDADIDSLGGPSVMQYSGSSWDYLGSRQFPTTEVPTDSSYGDRRLSLHVINESAIYLAFRNTANPSGLSVYFFNGSTWNDISPEAENVSGNISIHGLSTNAVYLTFSISNSGYVKKHDGSEWTSVGGIFADNGGRSFSLQVMDDTPYIAYSEVAGEYDTGGDNNSEPDRAVVKSWTGTAWEVAGDIISPGTATEITLIADDALYISYMDWNGVGSPTVYRYNGTAWTALGTSIIDVGTHYISMTVYNGKPFIACIGNEGENQDRVIVMRYN